MNKELFDPESAPDEHEYTVAEPTDEEKEKEGDPQVDKQEDATAVWNMIKDLHLELMFMYHRVCLKLSDIGPGKDYNYAFDFILNLDIENKSLVNMSFLQIQLLRKPTSPSRGKLVLQYLM